MFKDEFDDRRPDHFYKLSITRLLLGSLNPMRGGEIRGLLSICNNVMVSLPDTNEVRRSLEGLDFYVCIDFFMSEG